MLLLVLDGLFFLSTDPIKIPLSLIIFGFLLLGLTIYRLIMATLKLVAIYIPKIQNQHARLARMLTLTVVLLMAMQSIGQLSGRDAIALLPLVILSYLYLTHANTQKLKR